MKGMQYKAFPFECKADAEKGEFEGYASVFGNVDSWGDVVEPGAFRKTLQEDAHRVKVLWQHSPFHPIGRPLHMEEDSKGLYVKAKIAPTSLGKDALILMREGVINELSIGYTIEVEEFDRERNVRRLKQIKLYEFSPVTWAANDQALITAVKDALLHVTIGWPDGLNQLKPKRDPTPEDEIESVLRRLLLDLQNTKGAWEAWK